MQVVLVDSDATKVAVAAFPAHGSAADYGWDPLRIALTGCSDWTYALGPPRFGLLEANGSLTVARAANAAIFRFRFGFPPHETATRSV